LCDVVRSDWRRHGLIGPVKKSWETAMTNKQNFTPEEWTRLLESIMLSGIAVSAADPSGLWGTFKEAFASKSALAASKLDPASNELIKAVLADLETKEARSSIREVLHERFDDLEPTEVVQRSLDDLKAVSVILDAKAPGDAAAFKALLCGISQKVAEAAPEGGFLGFGGVDVSDAEKATLSDIAKALGRTA
jgi:hypothetical protein